MGLSKARSLPAFYPQLKSLHDASCLDALHLCGSNTVHKSRMLYSTKWAHDRAPWHHMLGDCLMVLRVCFSLFYGSKISSTVFENAFLWSKNEPEICGCVLP